MARSGEKWGTPTGPRPAAIAHTNQDRGVARQVFTGEYRHSVDDKGRIAVPARFRAQLMTGAYVSRWMERCLAIHTEAGWQNLSDRMAGIPITDTNGRLFSRFVFAGAVPAELDRQGRMLVPAFLREPIDLAGEAVVVGARDHVEIWAPDHWDVYRQALDDPDALAKAFEGLGI